MKTFIQLLMLTLTATTLHSENALFLSPPTINTLQLQGYDSNSDGVITDVEISNYAHTFNFSTLFSNYPGGESYKLSELTKDLKEISNYNGSFMFLMIDYDHLSKLGDFGSWNGLFVEIEPSDSIIYLSAQYSTNSIDFEAKAGYQESEIKVNKFDVSGYSEININGQTELLIDTLILENEMNQISNVNSKSLIIKGQSPLVFLTNFNGVEYINGNLFQTSGSATLFFSGQKTGTRFVCTNNNSPQVSNSISNYEITVSENCELNAATNQVNNQNTSLADLLVNANPSVDLNGDGAIQGWELVQADTIIIPNGNLDSLNGIHLAENLVYLDVRNNNLDTIELGNFPNLQYLNISGNNISLIDFNGTLESDEDNQSIQTLSSSSSLDSLIVDDNELTELDVSGLSISYLSATNNPNLSTICVSQSQLNSNVQNWDKDGSAQYSAQCSMTVGSNEVSVSNTTIYPNPTQGILNIKSDAQVGLVEVFELSGRKVLSTTNQSQIDISGLESGIYYLNVFNQAGDKLRTVNIVKK